MSSHEQLLRAVQIATRKLAGADDFQQVLKEVLVVCTEAVGAYGGTIYLHDKVNRRLQFRHVLPESTAEKMPIKDIADDQGVAGRVFQTRKTEFSVFEHDDDPIRKRIREGTGVDVRTMITVPLAMQDEEPIGVVQLINKSAGAFNENDAAVLDTVAAVSTLAYLNSRLLEEQSRASQLLGMGKVSHDIGNLAASLYANLSFSESELEMLRGEIPAEQVSPAAAESLDALGGMFTELRASVDRIVGYSRLVSDLSAGRKLRPNMDRGSLARTIRSSAAYLESEGRKNHVLLKYDICDGAPDFVHDELYVFRIVQNLVGNAIKAVHEVIPPSWLATHQNADEPTYYGDVTIIYRYEEGRHIVAVRDTGPGMTRLVAERILAGNARSMWEKGSGSGWGTKIVLELAATHGASVFIESEPGQGSEFRVEFPLDNPQAD